MKNYGMHIPNALSADDWIALGNEWRPDAHFIVSDGDVVRSRFVNELVGHFVGAIVAYSVVRQLGSFHVELQCDTPEHARELAGVYEKAHTASGKLRRGVAAYYSDPANLQLDDTGKPKATT